MVMQAALRWQELQEIAGPRNVRVDGPVEMDDGWVVALSSVISTAPPKTWSHAAKGKTPDAAIETALAILTERDPIKNSALFCPTCGRPRGE